jgi:hypothetical protein
MVSYLRCLDVPYESEKREPFLDLSVNTHGHASLEASLAAFIQVCYAVERPVQRHFAFVLCVCLLFVFVFVASSVTSHSAAVVRYAVQRHVQRHFVFVLCFFFGLLLRYVVQRHVTPFRVCLLSSFVALFRVVVNLTIHYIIIHAMQQYILKCWKVQMRSNRPKIIQKFLLHHCALYICL